MGVVSSVATALAVEQLVLTLVDQLIPLVGQAYSAATANDQATLDAIHAKAVLASNALAPPGAVDVAVADVPGS